MADLKNTKILKEKISKAGGCLIAVSKKFPVEDIRAVQSIGVSDFGENYISEALDKIEALSDLKIRWHFIGRVQSGNVNKIVNRFYLIHSIYKLEHLKKINQKTSARQKILLQIQHSKDERGFGIKEGDLFDFLEKSTELDKIDFAGLMFLPPPEMQGEELARAFKWASNLLQSIRNKMPKLGSWDTLSMGMSSDYELALSEGSTHVRIGTAVFGKRK